MPMEVECPFLNDFSDSLRCPYINKQGICDDIEINAGNGDAWCMKHIKRSTYLHDLDKE